MIGSLFDSVVSCGQEMSDEARSRCCWHALWYRPGCSHSQFVQFRKVKTQYDLIVSMLCKQMPDVDNVLCAMLSAGVAFIIINYFFKLSLGAHC